MSPLCTVVYFQNQNHCSVSDQATDEAELEDALNAALKVGYRHIDTATAYNNESIIGKVLKEWMSSGKLKRE